MLVAFYGRHLPAMTGAHRGYPLVPRSALFLGFQSVYHYIEDILNEQLVNVTLVEAKSTDLFSRVDHHKGSIPRHQYSRLLF